jgi:uncharacterized protein (TIGR02597 family)
MLKTNIKLAGAFALALTGSAAFAANEPISREVVVLPVSVGSGQNTLVGLPFIAEPVANGAATAVSGTTVSDTDGTFGSLSGTYSLAVTTGAARGTYVDITGFSGTNITIASAVTGLKVGDGYQIVPAFTLAKLFGSSAAEVAAKGIFGATSSTGADNILAFDSTGTLKRYYFNTNTNLLGGWRIVGGSATTNVGNNPLLNNSGLIINRPSAAAASTLYLSGVARKGAQALSIKAGANLYYHPNPVTVTLGNSGLYTGNPATGLQGATSSTSADTVRVFDASGGSKTYYFNTNTNILGGWREVGGSATASQSGVSIPAGVAVLLNRGTGSATILSLENVTP